MLKFLTLLTMLGVPTVAAAQDCTIFDECRTSIELGNTTGYDDGPTAADIGYLISDVRSSIRIRDTSVF
jgi:hypothetical protein